MKIKEDKLLHFIFSYAIVLTIQMWFNNLVISLTIAFLIGLAKEIYDIKDSNFSISDLIADVIGIMTALVTISMQK